MLGAVLAFATDWRWATRSAMNIDWQFAGGKKGDSTLLVRDPAFTAQVDAMLQADLRRSRQVSAEEIEDKPVWFPLAMGVARLFAPVL